MFFPCCGMNETESIGMKAEATQAVVVAAVFLVANDGVAQVLGMDADLVLSAGIEVEVDQ